MYVWKPLFAWGGSLAVFDVKIIVLGPRPWVASSEVGICERRVLAVLPEDKLAIALAEFNGT